MRLSIIVVLSLGLAGVVTASHSKDGQHWKSFKSKFNKLYSDPAEDSMRMRLFSNNKKIIDQHNEKAEAPFKMRLNHLAADWTSEQLRPKMNPKKIENKLEAMKSVKQEAAEFLKEMLAVEVDELPLEVDWRQVDNRVGPVKDKGYCLATWAFSATGLLEGQQAKLNFSSLIPLSEQNLIDCSESNFGCEGGFVDDALADIANNIKGIQSEQAYPYKVWDKRHSDEKCTFDGSKSILAVKGAQLLDANEVTLQKVVAQFGPVSIGMEATDKLIFYDSGIFYDKHCSSSPAAMNEQMLVVGYGVDELFGDYWIVKAAWGSKVLDKGYFKIARNKDNHCGIANYATIPIFE